MTNHDPAHAGWFADILPDDADSATAAIAEGTTDQPRHWPEIAVESGFAADVDDYYDRLHKATLDATRTAVAEHERADDRQLVHAIRSLDDCERTANELAERAAEWAGGLFADVDAGIEGAREVATYEPNTAAERRAVSLATRVVDLADEAEAIREFIERTAPAVAPNLAAMAGPVLASRLIALAGGLEALAKKPSGTVQVLGAEDALFAHLEGHAPSPKHGIIFTHEYVRETRPADRGSAARALAGKLTIAARIDHYSGDHREGVHEDLRDRIATIRARAEDDEDGAEGDR
ncbi:rRNA biogenesis protein Nop56/Nop58 [Halopenitus malekzadehii]|uniref:rRNA biogenesis protein Nop56/Nop58 n=1 Tax=Halopenitus malekzadehii TaxID=1267564 RepID=A0A1H6IGE4_9EURY|nr:NOP5/NOP56 family protein [Halopenitus malekzadehii]SEH46960.1 rRNA biogenesis protein Nop56/Nop58 [Halopenitus malekzadehii]